MYECDICRAKIKKRNKNKHEKSMKLRYFSSNMLVNKYVVKNNDINKFKNILHWYCDEHKKKFNEYTVSNIWKKRDMIINKISIPRTITLRRTHMFKPDVFEIPIYVKVSEREFLDIVDKNCAYKIISVEIDIIFISKLKELTLQHYMKQPRSILCRKIERNYVQECDPPSADRDFDYNFLPYCFGHIGFQPPAWHRIILRWKEYFYYI